MAKRKNKLRLLEAALAFFWAKGYLPNSVPVLPDEYGGYDHHLRRSPEIDPTDGKTLGEAERWKHCSCCGLWKPATREFWAINRTCRDGLESQCKICKAGRERVRRFYLLVDRTPVAVRNILR